MLGSDPEKAVGNVASDGFGWNFSIKVQAIRITKFCRLIPGTTGLTNLPDITSLAVSSPAKCN